MAVIAYTEEYKDIWDAFVLESSVNGNFLQTRRFLNYHPEGRFEDCSLLYKDSKDNLRAVIPAAIVYADGKKRLVSHPGSTYGGIVIDQKTCSAKRIEGLLNEFKEYLVKNEFDEIDLRFPPSFMWKTPHSGLVEYMLQLFGFSAISELTTYIDFSFYQDNVVSNFSQGKRTCINHALEAGMVCRPLETEHEIEQFYRLLLDNLKKFDAQPVHTYEEIKYLAQDVLKGESQLLGVFLGSELLAAGWVFLFKNMNVVHTQYLCASEERAYAKMSPMTFLYYSVIQRSKASGFSKVSWGISTEEKGAILNRGLTESKESYGSCHDVHKRFFCVLR